MITVIVGGVKVLCFKAFLGWGAFVVAFLGNYATPPAQPGTPPPATAPGVTYPFCPPEFDGGCLPCRLIGGCPIGSFPNG